MQDLPEYLLDTDPIASFERWFALAREANLPLPESMTLATATSSGKVSARMVLLKEVKAGDFLFFTNFRSPKCNELSRNKNAALVFFWAPLEKQIRIVGAVEKVSRKESEAYFRTRPRGSQIGAWASAQSSVLKGRAQLEANFAKFEKKFAGKDVPCPPHWGGFRLKPKEIEFWSGRESRLHDRFRYRRQKQGWKIERLSP